MIINTYNWDFILYWGCQSQTTTHNNNKKSVISRSLPSFGQGTPSIGITTNPTILLFFKFIFLYPFLVKLLYQLNFYFISSYLNIEYLKILSKLFKITSNIISVVIISVVIISVVIISVVIISVVIISVVIISVVIISVDFYIRCYLNIFTNIKNIYIFLLGFNQTPNFIEVHYIPIFISSYIFFYWGSTRHPILLRYTTSQFLSIVIYYFLLGFNQTPNFIEVHYISIFKLVIYFFYLGFNQTPNFIEVHYISIFINSYIFFIGVQPDTQFYGVYYQ